jgi:HlyD family secretion protein
VPLAARRRILIALAVLAALAAVAVLVVRERPAPSSTLLSLSGRLEGYQSDLGAKVGGRVAWVAVREGALVHAGQTVVQLDDAGARAALGAATAAVAAAESRARQSEATLGVLASQLNESGLARRQASADSSGRVAQARATLAAARAQIAQAAAGVRQAEANLTLARNDRTRYEALSRSGDVALQRAQQADTAAATAVAAVEQQRAVLAAAERGAASAQAGVDLAQSTSYNAPIRAMQAETLERQQRQAHAQIAATHADANQARAALRQAMSALNDLTVRAASDGTVIARAVEPGDVVAPGRTLLSVVDLNRIYMRGYVPDGAIGRVRIGQTARVTLDSSPNQPLDARVSEIDAQASFTPENVYFKQDRVQQVFGVKLDLLAGHGFAKPGMPVDAVIDIGSP